MFGSVEPVRLVANIDPSQSVHEWTATNVRSMDRTNKMSSPAFYIPNDTMRRHQFRFVLLRGIERGATPEDDPLGIFLEYLPPAPDGHPVAEPGTCRVSVWCLNRSLEGSDEAARGEPHLYEQHTHKFTQTDRTVGFRALVPASALRSSAFVDESGFNAVRLRVELVVGVSLLQDVVAQTADRWGSSLWGSAASALRVLQSSVDMFKTQVQSALDERAESPQRTPVPAKTLPWDELPAAWKKAGASAEQWRRLLTDTLVEDEGTFLTGAGRGLLADEQVLLTQLGINHKLVLSTASLFDFDRDVHEGLLTVPALRAQRFALVPRRVSDELFWAHYMWRVAVLSAYPAPDQIRLLLTILNAPSKAPAQAEASDTATSERVAAAIRDALEAADVLRQLVAETDGRDDVLVKAARESIRSHAGRLEDLQRDCAEDALGQALLETQNALLELLNQGDLMEDTTKPANPSDLPPASEPSAEPETESEAPVMSTEALEAALVEVTSPRSDVPDAGASSDASPLAAADTPPASAPVRSTADHSEISGDFIEDINDLGISKDSQTPQSRADTGGNRAASSASASRKFDFEPMPWDEDE